MTSITLTVYDDPEKQLSGSVRGELTNRGLQLTSEQSHFEHFYDVDDLLVPLGAEARWPRGNFVLLPLKDRTVTVCVTQGGVDQYRLARDLADWIRKKKYRLDDADYRLPSALWVVAVLPALAPIAALIHVLGGTRPMEECTALSIAIGAGFIVALLVFLWSFAGRPNVGARVFVFLIMTLLAAVGIAATWAHQEGELINFLARLPRGPGSSFPPESWRTFTDPKREFTVDMPGEAIGGAVKSKVPTELHVAETTFTQFAVGIVSLPKNVVGELKLLPAAEIVAVSRSRPDAPGSRKGQNKGTVLTDIAVTHQGVEGRGIVMRVPGQPDAVIRQFSWKGRLILLVATGPRYGAGTPDVKRFFSSLDLNQAR